MSQGRALADCGIARSDIFITTKLWTNAVSPQGVGSCVGVGWGGGGGGKGGRGAPFRPLTPPPPPPTHPPPPLHPPKWGYDQAKAAIRASLTKLGTPYVDLMLLHAPGDPATRAETWAALEDAVGEVRAREGVGVEGGAGRSACWDLGRA